MGYSRIETPYSGGAQVFTVNFSLGYLDRADVTAYVQEEVDGLGQPALRAFTWLSDTQIQMTEPLPNPCVVVTDRTVSKNQLTFDVGGGADVTRNTLSRQHKQLMMALHELIDGRVSSFFEINLVTGFVDAAEAFAVAAELALAAAEAAAADAAALSADVDLALAAALAAEASAQAAALSAITAAANMKMRAVSSLTELRSISTSQYNFAVLVDAATYTSYVWVPGNWTVQVAALDENYVAPNADISGASGCWVHPVLKADAAEFHRFLAKTDKMVSFEVEAVETANSYWSIMGGLPNFGPDGTFGPTLSVKGTGDNIPGIFAAKGERGFYFGNVLGRMFEVVSGAAGFVTGRIPKLRPGSTAAAEYASLDAEDGVDIKASGIPVVRILNGAGAGTARMDISNQGANYVSIVMDAGKSLAIVAPGGMNLQKLRLVCEEWTVFSPASGATIAAGAYNGVHLINPLSNPIATLTINLPASVPDGTLLRFSVRAGVTAVTWASLGGHGITGAPSSLSSSTPITMVFLGVTYGWQRWS